jgi:hypothetical protein
MSQKHGVYYSCKRNTSFLARTAPCSNIYIYTHVQEHHLDDAVLKPRSNAQFLHLDIQHNLEEEKMYGSLKEI